MRARRDCLPGTWLVSTGALSVWYIILHRHWAPFSHSPHQILHILWVFGIAALPTGLYCVCQAARRKWRERKIQSAFTASGLVNPLGRPIRIVGLEPLDKFTTRVALTNVSQSIQDLQKLRERLGTNLWAHVEEFRESRTRGIIELILSVGEIPAKLELTIEDYLKLKPAQVLIGESRGSKNFYLNFDQYPHLLVAGTTGGGKSSFLRHLIVTLRLNSTNERFFLIDLKGEAEFNTYRGLENMSVYSDAHEVVDPISGLATLIDGRMRIFKENEVADLDSYLLIPAKKRKSVRGAGDISMARTYVIVDEAADLFLASSKHHPQKIRQLREDFSLIARKGRAAGIHLVISLQKPEVRAIDAQIKSCMTSVLCFPMANDSDSISAIGVGRATDLPRMIKGRAIWKLGGDLWEVQIPWISKEKAKELLSSKRKVDVPNDGTASQGQISCTDSSTQEEQEVTHVTTPA